VSAPREVLTALVAKWRCDAVDDDCWDKDERGTFDRCARELEAALATPPAVGVVATDIVRAAVSDAIVRELQVADDLRHDTAARHGAARKAQAMREWLAATPPAVGRGAVHRNATERELWLMEQAMEAAGWYHEGKRRTARESVLAWLNDGISDGGHVVADQLFTEAPEPPAAPTEGIVWVDGETMAALDGASMRDDDGETDSETGRLLKALLTRCRVAPGVE